MEFPVGFQCDNYFSDLRQIRGQSPTGKLALGGGGSA